MVSLLFESDSKRFARCHRDAQGYHARAKQFADEKRPPSLVFNVGSMAIESYLVALCAFFKVMPSNHNFGNLLADAQSVTEIDPALAQAIGDLDRIFGICSIDDYHHGAPQAADAENVLYICNRLQETIAALNPTPALS